MSIEVKFEQASRLKLRFDTVNGQLCVEDLWDIPLTTTIPAKRTSLDEIAKSLHKKLNSGDNISFVDQAIATDQGDQLRFELVKHVITTKVADNKAANEASQRAQRKQQLLSLIAEKQNQALGTLSIEELQKQVSEL